MIYADTDFFLALMKGPDWLKENARQLLEEHRGDLWTSHVALIDLLLLAAKFKLDPERLLVDVLELVKIDGADSSIYLQAAHLMKQYGSGVFDSLHAAHCGPGRKILSSDRVFDKLGLARIDLTPRDRQD